MADAAGAPGNPEDKYDILSRLDRIFDDFWCKLENRMCQPALNHPDDHPPHKPNPTIQLKFTAAAMHRASTWRRGGIKASLGGTAAPPQNGKYIPWSRPSRSSAVLAAIASPWQRIKNHTTLQHKTAQTHTQAEQRQTSQVGALEGNPKPGRSPVPVQLAT
ncbi:Hypothetical predicted protein [Pelobates cultripes]|uniref:Uncharacterized protein n=1 Tax=Pelobates cultripes TaxID=61616 RepID=A0AAD1RR69_PELCU|nr:Hypothetical predicted protein [Pelobates cultripes]